jgi:hypothetical protein
MGVPWSDIGVSQVRDGCVPGQGRVCPWSGKSVSLVRDGVPIPGTCSKIRVSQQPLAHQVNTTQMHTYTRGLSHEDMKN